MKEIILFSFPVFLSVILYFVFKFLFIYIKTYSKILLRPFKLRMEFFENLYKGSSYSHLNDIIKNYRAAYSKLGRLQSASEKIVKNLNYKMLERIDEEQKMADFEEWCKLQKRKEEIEKDSGISYPRSITKKNKNYPAMAQFDL